MISADFSADSQPIVMTFYKHYFLLTALEISLKNMYSLKVNLFNMYEINKNVALYNPISFVSEFHYMSTSESRDMNGK